MIDRKHQAGCLRPGFVRFGEPFDGGRDMHLGGAAFVVEGPPLDRRRKRREEKGSGIEVLTYRQDKRVKSSFLILSNSNGNGGQQELKKTRWW